MMENLLNILMEAKRIRRSKTQEEEKTGCVQRRDRIDWTCLGLAVWLTAA